MYLGWEWVPNILGKNKTSALCKNKGKEMASISEHYHPFGFPRILSEGNLKILRKCIQDF